ncbi:MAG: hypothetical protein M1834_008758 [Cirrosporium novae-zelandiae]|nr:MAG: hypothetical protein M1834_008758 [Cirrosporium novae-zelandiae]
MASPAKRRRRNGHTASSQPVRSLDYFFNKQKKDQESQRERKVVTRDLYTSEGSKSRKSEHSDNQTLSDETLARRLQAEWNEQLEPSIASTIQKTIVENTEEKDEKNRSKGSFSRSESQEDSITSFTPRLSTPVAAASNTTITEAPNEVPGNHFDHRDRKKPSDKVNFLSLQAATATEDVVSAGIPFDESVLTFDPSKYLPDLDDLWASEGGDASYSLLARCFVIVNGTTSRIKIVDTLVNLLRIIIEANPSSLLPAVWLATNSISPPYVSLELGLSSSAISKALKKVCGLDNAGFKTLYDKHGDAGDVAFEAKKKQSFTLRKPKPLSIKGVYQSLVKIAMTTGRRSQEAKQHIVERLIQDARGAEESRYIVRTLMQHLRIGAAKTTMLIALSRAFLLSRPAGSDFSIYAQANLAKLKKGELTEIYSKAEGKIKACFARHPNYDDLIPCLLEVGISHELLLRCGLALHIPLFPMLGSITRDLGEMLTKLQGRNFSCEYKYDGQRAQIHCDSRGKVSIFSRHLEVMTDKYPDLVSLVPKIRGDGVESFILEGEVVAIDRETGDLKPFQMLTNRARKEVTIGSVTVEVCLFAFDLMYLNGEELLNRSFRERREILRSLFVEVPYHFMWVKSLDVTSGDSEAVLEFFKSAIEMKCEGIMVKVLDNLLNPDFIPTKEADKDNQLLVEQPTLTKKTRGSKGKSKSTKLKSGSTPEEILPGCHKALLSTYEPDKRLDSWLKVKKDYHSSSDTLDLIPIAGWHGQGRKATWWSPILLAVRNAETGSLEAITKCMSGFTDEFYIANKDKYGKYGDNVLGTKPSYIDYTGTPDIWFEPQEVWETAFADITLSPTYTAAIGLINEERGLSLRFPRFLKVREDKSIDEASTAEFLAGLYRKQESRIKEEASVGRPSRADENGNN